MNKDYNEFENNTQGTNGQYNTYELYNAPINTRKRNGLAKKIGMLVLSGAILGTAAGGALAATTYFIPHKTSVSQKQETTSLPATLTSFSDTSSAAASKASVQAIASKCMPSIVAITNVGVTETRTIWGNVSQPSESCGSGIIIGETDKELLIVTNNHVISGSKTLTIVFSYDEDSDKPEAVEAYIKGYDSKKDLAVIGISKSKLKEDVLKKISVAAIGKSSDLNLGEQVVAIGNALGYGQSVTTGIVSALNRHISSDSNNSDKESGNKYIQTDAAINPGNSGGALFNMKGELVGINTAKIASNEIEGMGYAIPISDVYDLIENMMNQTARTEVVEQNKRGSLGVSASDVSSEATQTYGIPEGVYMYDVPDDSSAANAGIKKGYVLTKFDGKSVSSVSDLQKLLTYYKAGETVTVTAQVPNGSSYEEKEFSVQLEKSKNTTEDATSTPTQAPNEYYSGNDPFEFLNPFSADYFGNNIA